MDWQDIYKTLRPDPRDQHLARMPVKLATINKDVWQRVKPNARKKKRGAKK